VERSTTGRSSGVSLPLDLHIARRARRRGGRCPFRPDDRRTGPAAVRPAPTGHPAATSRPDGGDRETRSPSPESGPGLPGRTRGRCPSTPSAGRAGDGAAPVPSAGRPASVPGVRGPGPPGEPGSVALSTPFTLTRLPVPSLASPSFGLRSSWGAPSTSVRCELPRLTTGEPADRPGSWWLLAPHRTRFRIVSRVRFPPRSTRRSVSKDSVSRPRCACSLTAFAGGPQERAITNHRLAC
jgi:hypothetical protein